jgi:hypothetical protein
LFPAFIGNLVNKLLSKIPLKNLDFLPANRLFYPTYWSYIYELDRQAQDKIRNRVLAGELPVEALFERSYTANIDALIKKINNISRTTQIPNHYPELVAEMEVLMGGNLSFESKIEGLANKAFQFKPKDTPEELGMYLASSSVNQLSLLYIYFKYWANKSHNVLIIDEPEENLHPRSQIKLLDILIRFADMNNNKVIITTHSNLMANAVNNHIHLAYLHRKDYNVSTLGKEIANNYQPKKELKDTDFGVYFFNGTAIKKYAINEYGAYFEDFEKAEQGVKDTSETLKNIIYSLNNPQK